MARWDDTLKDLLRSIQVGGSKLLALESERVKSAVFKVFSELSSFSEDEQDAAYTHARKHVQGTPEMPHRGYGLIQAHNMLGRLIDSRDMQRIDQWSKELASGVTARRQAYILEQANVMGASSTNRVVRDRSATLCRNLAPSAHHPAAAKSAAGRPWVSRGDSLPLAPPVASAATMRPAAHLSRVATMPPPLGSASNCSTQAPLWPLPSQPGAHPTPTPIRRGLKAPWSAEETCLYGIKTDVKIREVYAGKDEKYYVSAPLTFEPGTAKKLRIAKRRSDGGVFAVLTMHGPDHVSKSWDRKRTSKQTLKSAPHLIDNEARIATIVDRRLAPVDRLLIGTDEWHVTTLMYGDAHNFIARAPAEKRRELTRKLMLDIGASLTLRVHANKFLHNDLKLQNVLIDTEEGCARLSDFGSATRIVNGRSDYCMLGTYPAPEVVLNVAYDGKADVYAWGASFGDGHLSSRECPNPLLYISNDTGGVDLRAMATLHDQFEAWRTSDKAMGPDGRIDPRRFEPGSRFGGYFHRLARADREVCIFVLERMLVWLATDRATSAECHAFFSQLAANDPAGHNRATQYLSALPRRDTHQKVIDRLDEYYRLARLWEARLP